jgi:predicted GNAT superfamily acetyltransferase
LTNRSGNADTFCCVDTEHLPTAGTGSDDQVTDIRTLSGPDELAGANDVLQRVWGTDVPLVPLELLVAVAHTGGYVAGAFEGDEMVGASLGLLAQHLGRPALHSHVTGLLPTARGTGLGRAVKLHQRAWAIARGLERITWTFDPLVRRNAWFNIAVLGVRVEEYLPSFYGSMSDAINAGDESDRLYVSWDLAAELPSSPRDGGSRTEVADLVPTPDDIVALRRTDPGAVAGWRSSTRRALVGALDAGRSVVGFTRDGNYVIGSTP